MMPLCIKDLGQSSILQLHGFSIERNVICIHKIFYIIQKTYKGEVCFGFWVKGFKVKVDQDKNSIYLQIAGSLVLTNSWPPVAMWDPGQHRPYHWEQPFLHFTHAGKQASCPCFQEKSEVGYLCTMY